MIFEEQIMKLCIFLTILLLSAFHFCACDEEEEDVDYLSRTVRVHFSSIIGRECVADGMDGICQRRSRCKTPSTKICRRSVTSIVCCLPEKPLEPDRPTPKPRPTTPKTTNRPRTTTRRTVKPVVTPVPEDNSISDGGIVDITFPGCGYRFPSAPEPNEHRAPQRSVNNGPPLIGGILTRVLGKRDVSEQCKDRNTDQCSQGRAKRQVRPVIVGGSTTGSHGYPWMMALYRKMSRTERFLCGASLISKRYVLTAAHCFDGINNLSNQKFSLRIGSHTAKDGTLYDVERVILHPSYKQGQYYNDMALLELRTDVKLTTKSYPVCLPSPSLRNRMVQGKKLVMVMGWGDTSFGGRSSKELMEVEMPIVPVKQCNASYSTIAKDNFPKGISNLFICAGLKDGGKDACQGDSGGPLVMQMKDTAFVQLGIVSFGYGCAQLGYPGVYTRVSKFTNWIHDNTDLR